MKQYIKIILSILSILSLISCSGSSHIIIGNTRPPISPEQVKLYLKPPAKYEEIAILQSSNQASPAITDQGKIEVAIRRIKEEAASLGANGVLIQNTSDVSGGSIGSGTATANGNTAYGFGASASILYKTINGLAIYVHSENQEQ